MFKTLTTTAIMALSAQIALAETQSIDVGAFSQIDVNGAIHLVHTTGPQTSITLETPGNDFSDASLSVEGDTLVITRHSLKKRGLFGSSANLRISDEGRTIRVNGKEVPFYTVHITSPDLTGIKARQSSRAAVRDVTADSFQARASSSSRIELSGTAAQATLNASSDGKIEAASFQAGSLSVDVSSDGETNATVSGTGDVRVSASSSGEVTLHSLQPANFSINASSGSEVELSGACNQINITASSGSDIEAEKLTCSTAIIKASSGTDVSLRATSSATANASSGADITVYGNPVSRQADKSSGGSVQFRN